MPQQSNPKFPQSFAVSIVSFIIKHYLLKHWIEFPYDHLILQAEVCWLSPGRIEQHFVKLSNAIFFFKTKNVRRAKRTDKLQATKTELLFARKK